MLIQSVELTDDIRFVKLNGVIHECTHNSSRQVLFFGPFVVKIDNGKGPWRYQNQTELAKWEEVKDTDDAKYFAKILESGENEHCSWLVMAHVPGAGEKFSDTAYQLLIPIRDRWQVGDLAPCLNVFHNPATYEPVIVDYGM